MKPGRLPGIASMLLALVAFLLNCYAEEIPDVGPCGPPPPPKPQQRAGAEGLPPLPLPAVPLRRTEKKQPPKPPVLVAKLRYGSQANWLTDENDINNLLLWLKTKMGIGFSWEIMGFREFPFNPGRIPVLYMTGHFGFDLSDGERAGIRDFLLRGGTLWIDSCCGRKEFQQSAEREIALIFPEKPLVELPLDHPVYHTFYDIAGAQYTPAARAPDNGRPRLRGIDIGCRTALIYSADDLSCGWDMHTHKTSAGYISPDALKLGANMVAYALGTRTLGMAEASIPIPVAAVEPTGQRLTIGQVAYDGNWQTNPGALSNLLTAVETASTVPVGFERKKLTLTSKELQDTPLIYITGHYDFSLNDDEAKALRAYLLSGGFLFADACCGRKSFDQAFRKLLRRALPDHSLQVLPSSHPIYTLHEPVTEASLKPGVLVIGSGRTMPALEAITVDGELVVVYSRYSLGCGWQLKPCPYCAGYEPRDAIKLGVNIVMWALTH